MQVYCGIDEVGKVLGKDPEELNEWSLKKKFIYDGVTFTQLADVSKSRYKKAFEPSGEHKYSTTYDKVYDENGEWKK